MPNLIDGGTPRYNLLSGTRRLGPPVLPPSTAGACSPIYGFRDKSSYDRFVGNCELALTPYPLVRDYLRGQVAMLDEGPRLIVMDAASPREPLLRAATMEAVLEAHEQRAEHVSAAYQLRLDPEADAYRIERMSD